MNLFHAEAHTSTSLSKQRRREEEKFGILRWVSSKKFTNVMEVFIL